MTRFRSRKLIGRWRRRLDRINAGAARFNRVAGWIFAWVIPPFFALLILIAAPADLGPAWKAAHGAGPRGTFIVERMECNDFRRIGPRCTGLHGTFVPDNDPDIQSAAFLDTIPRGSRIGDHIEVIHGPRDAVYLAHDSHEWMIITGLIVAAVITLLIWGGRLMLTARRRPGRSHF